MLLPQFNLLNLTLNFLREKSIFFFFLYFVETSADLDFLLLLADERKSVQQQNLLFYLFKIVTVYM